MRDKHQLSALFGRATASKVWRIRRGSLRLPGMLHCDHLGSLRPSVPNLLAQRAPSCATASGIAGVCHIPNTFKNLAGEIPKGSLYITPEEPAAGLAAWLNTQRGCADI